MTTTVLEAPSVLGTARGKLILALLCGVALMDLIDATIVNIALPSIRSDLDFSTQQLQWVPSGYLLTYGGMMLLGGRASDLLGRRRVLLGGLAVFGIASLVGGFAGSAEALVAARLVQGVGAALTMPATLSILTTTFHQTSDRRTAIGVWGGLAGLASAAGVLLGGVFTQGPGWRWVMFINPIICVLLLVPVLRLLPDDRPAASRRGFDLPGAVLVTSAMLLLVYTLVEAPDRGWGDVHTLLGLFGTVVLAGTFLLVESISERPLVPLSIARVPGLVSANVVQLAAVAGMISMFFFLTLYMETVLGFSPIRTGLAYLPICFGIGLSAGISSQLIAKTGSRVLIVAGSLIGGAGIFLLSRMSADGGYLTDVLPGMLVFAVGIGAVFVTVTAAANAGVEPERAGLAAALISASQQIGGALGLAVLSAVATSHTHALAASGVPHLAAATGGYGRALLVGAGFLVLAAVLGLRTTNTHEAEA